MNKLRAFLQMDVSSKKLMIEAYFLLAWARYRKSIPFERLAPSLGSASEETSTNSLLERRELAKISQSIQIVSRYTFWESQCMVKAIAAMKMLERRQLSSTLYFGTARDESGEMIAHAWLRCGPYYITGAEGMEKFTVVGKFAKRVGGQQHEAKTELI
ncbi:lasso peptide biosynthesis B2 protein [Halobacillus sp. A5]|uniref:lasso peptide biosynthesis B2 protein n=1 Tax=Halobacillus sp. A5 TaxID=2880263 RepID=UPI0020A62214|nr:lasso peptide biosynthesis B2 protein [Halobacillus sp. A5]MCP3029176.1 lasso peptide biosynthesis B2 protein [Halobacillus sp. A5]